VREFLRYRQDGGLRPCLDLLAKARDDLFGRFASPSIQEQAIVAS